MQIDTNDLRKKALTDQLAGPAVGAGASPDLASFSAPPSAPSGPDLPPSPIAASAPSAPSGPASPFQSNNRSVRGYLDEAARAYAPTIKGIQDEAGRKAAAQSYLQSLIPEVQARGGSMADVRDEKATVDGRVIDFYRDIEGAADGQFLDITDEARGGGGPAMGGGPAFGGIPLDGALNGDPLAKIQQAIAQLSGSRPNFDALLAELGGAQ